MAKWSVMMTFASRLSFVATLLVAFVLAGCGAPTTAKSPRAYTSDEPAGTPTAQEPTEPAAAASSPWVGVWLSTSSAYKTQFTIEMKRGVPTVTRIAETAGDKEVFEVRSSSWQEGTLKFSYYVPSTTYLVSYVCTDVEDDALKCRWSNDHAMSGSAKLPRVGGGAVVTKPASGGDAQARGFEGVWQDPDTAYSTRMTVQLRGGTPTVVRSAESTGDLEVYEVRSSSYQGGTLRWSHFVPSTSYLVTYTCQNPGSDSMTCRWFNDHNASGSVVLQRVGGGSAVAPPQADAGARQFEGVWQDPDTAYSTRMTVQMRGGTPTVVRSAESTGDMEVYEVRSSSFQNGTLRWSHFVPSTNYLVTYTCSTVRGDTMTCRWFNDHNASGSVNLTRVGGAPSTPPPQAGTDGRAFEGTWQDPNTVYKTNMTVVLRAGTPTVVRSAESIGDKEVYQVRSSTFQGGTLTWSHFVPSTGYLVTYACSAVRGDTMVCRWTNDHNASGSVNLQRVSGGAAVTPPPPPPPRVGPKQREDSRD